MSYRYVPETKGEVSDLIGAMTLCMPDMELPHTNLGLDGAYALLEESLGIIRSKIGDEKYHTLIAMARESKQHFGEGDDRSGIHMLQDMGELLRKRG